MLGLQTLLEKQSTAIDIPELVKDRTPNRADVLADKIEKEEPVTLVSGLTTTFDKEKNAQLVQVLRGKNRQALERAFTRNTRYIPVLVDKRGNTYTLNAIAKTGEFGGGAKGHGGGTAVEKTSEIGQALALGMVTALGKDIVPTDFTPQNLMAGAEHVMPQVSQQHVEQIIQLITQDKFWARSFSQVANALSAKLQLQNKMYHRDSQWVTDLKVAYEVANRMTQPKLFANFNKWNPSDIWAVSPNIEAPEPGLDMEELNAWMLEHFNKQSVYGLSLKKTGPTATVTVHNLDSMGEKLKMLMKDLVVTKSHQLENLFATGDTYMSYEAAHIPLSFYYLLNETRAKPATSDQVQYRSFGGAIQGEIQGRRARHGKVGFGSINAVLRSMTGQAITDYRNVRAYMQDPKKREETIGEVINMGQEVMGQQATRSQKEKLMASANQTPESKLIAKFQAVQLLYIIHNYRKKNKKKADQFLTQLLQYASSQSPLSSVFVKVS